MKTFLMGLAGEKFIEIHFYSEMDTKERKTYYIGDALYKTNLDSEPSSTKPVFSFSFFRDMVSWDTVSYFKAESKNKKLKALVEHVLKNPILEGIVRFETDTN